MARKEPIMTLIFHIHRIIVQFFTIIENHSQFYRNKTLPKKSLQTLANNNTLQSHEQDIIIIFQNEIHHI